MNIGRLPSSQLDPEDARRVSGPSGDPSQMADKPVLIPSSGQLLAKPDTVSLSKGAAGHDHGALLRAARDARPDPARLDVARRLLETGGDHDEVVIRETAERILGDLLS